MVKSVKEVLSDDFWIMPATPEYKAEGIPYITSKNIKNGVIDFGNVNYISEEDYESISKNRPIKIGDILISMIGTLGETAEVTEHDGKFYGQNMFLVRLNNETVNKRYFLNFFQSGAVKRALAGSQNQSTQKYLKANHIEDLQIPVPSIEEQSTIANRLDLLSLVITQRKTQLDTLDELIKARFVEMFGDIKDTCEVGYYIGSLTAGKSLAGEVECENKVLKTGAASFDYFDATQVKNLPLDYEPQTDHLVKPGDIIISRMNTTELTGATAYVWDVQDNVYLPDRLWKANLKEDCNPIFVWQMLIQPSTKEQIRRECSGTSGSMKNISKPGMLAIKVKKISFELQNQFAEFVKQVDKSKVAVEKALDETQTLFDSLMQEYFG